MQSDKHRILQILVNLLRNAKYACDEDPKSEKLVQIYAKCIDSERVEISVIDNGIGIPSENLKSIFQHGFTTRPEGTGYGLHSCANLASEIGGFLDVHSHGHGLGAKFTLTIPIVKRDETLPASKPQ